MLGSDIEKVGWPACGEIDIMEFIGKEPTKVFGTIHGPGYSGDDAISRSTTLPENAKVSDDFHIFAVEWSESEIRWYLDGKRFSSISKRDLSKGSRWAFKRPHFLILNFAVGGKWPGSPDASTVFPQSMLIDYIRVTSL
jgi:beta-glucanase (GH16 family)